MRLAHQDLLHAYKQKAWSRCTVQSACQGLASVIFNCVFSCRILSKVGQLVWLWSTPLKEKLVSEMAQWSKDQLTRLLIAVQQYLIITYYENDSQPNDKMHKSIVLLALMSEANDQSRVVPFSEFYLDIVNNEDFDLRRDYMKWKHPSSVPNYLFSFCHFAFVYDPASKTDILAAENTGTMRDQFQDAIFESIFGGGSCPFLVLRVSHPLLCTSLCSETRWASLVIAHSSGKIHLLTFDATDD